MLELFIYACLLTLTHELAVERVKALWRQPSYVTFSRGCFSVEWDCSVRAHTYTLSWQMGSAGYSCS